MSLLIDIQNDVIADQVSITTLLRKCKILAYKLSSDEFKSWVSNELTGYNSSDNLPTYRVTNVVSEGNFQAQPYGQICRNLQIPLMSIPKEHYQQFAQCHMRETVSAIQNLLNNNEDILHEIWHPDIVTIIGDKIYQDCNCLSAWKLISKHFIAQILDSVRTKVLDFVLAIGEELPDFNTAENYSFFRF